MKLSARIGAVEFQGDDVRVVVVKTGGKRPAVLEREARRLPEGLETEEERFEALVAAVRDMTASLAANPGAWVLCAPGEASVARVLGVPLKGRARVAAAVQFELEPFLAFPIDELEVDHTILRESDGQTEVLAIGLRHEAVAGQLAVLEAAGIDPEGINIDAAGLTELWLGTAPNEGLRVGLHVRDNGAVLSAADGGKPVFFRHLGMTAAAMEDGPARAGGEVAMSLRAFLATWKTEAELAGLTVTGATLSHDARAAFEEALPVPVTYLDLTDAVKFEAKKGGGKKNPPLSASDARPVVYEPGGNEFAAAIGVALAAAGGRAAYNFRKGALSQRAPWRGVAAHAGFTLALAVVGLLGWFGYLVADYRYTNREVARVGEEIWELYATTFPDSPAVREGRPPQDIGGVQTMKLFQQAMDAQVQRSQSMDPDLLARPTLLDIIRELSTRLSSENVLITNVSIRPSSERSQMVTIEGELRSPTVSLSQELQRLRESELLSITSEPVQSSRDGRTEFTITARTEGAAS